MIQKELQNNKKKLVQINTVCNGSTGTIMKYIQERAQEKDYEAISYYGRRSGFKKLLCRKFGHKLSFFNHVILTFLFDAQGLGSYFDTKRLLKWLREEKPDIIHLHNIHGYYLNYPELFHFLKEEFQGKVVWTFHDCWPFTGHCPYFTIVNCNKWQIECSHCPNKYKYPISLFWDGSRKNFSRKKELFTSIPDMVITCPSIWMKEKINQSFMNKVRCEVVPNGIDFTVFYPHVSDKILNKYKIEYGQKVVLGVANIWEERKGLEDFVQLAKILPDVYKIVLVGLSWEQVRKLHRKNIYGIQRTENQDELAQLYTYATVFMNPSREESFSLVTIEAMACGTPVIALDSSAPKELVNKENGILLSESTAQDYLTAILKLDRCDLPKEKIVDSVKRYSVENMTSKMLEIYEGKRI